MNAVGGPGGRRLGGRSSWLRIYRLALCALPASLRRKHGAAMERLFEEERTRARARGRLHGVLAEAAGVWDVLRRGAYERLRVLPSLLLALRSERSLDGRSVNAHGRAAGANLGDAPMPLPSTYQLLRRLGAALTVALPLLTGLLVANLARQRLPELSARGDSVGTMLEVLVFSLPHTMALTIPMAVFIAVLWVFTRLGAEGVLESARLRRSGLRRLVAPVLGAAAGFSALTTVLNTEVLPRANGRLVVLFVGGEPVLPQNDRVMTVPELRAAARSARAEAGPRALERAAAYEVEVQKKYALAAASVVLALAAVAVGLRFPRGRLGLVVVASFAVFGTYYFFLVTGESLADDRVVSPVVAMWGANGLLLAAAVLGVWRRRPLSRARIESIAVGA